MSIAFVILHYLTHEDTVECVESIIKSVGTNDYKIIIVDNGSNNGSVEYLQDLYKNNNNICFILNKVNLGFAKGLNTGIELAKKMKAEFIVTTNNDVILLTKNFYQVIKNKYEETNFSVAGPMIITKDDKCSCNPMRNSIRSLEETLKYIKIHENIRKLIKYRLFWLLNIKRKIFRNDKNVISNKDFLYDQINHQLHGSFWIFSKEYFNFFDGIDPKTFLYGEESILFLHLMMNKLTTLYTPELCIYHKEDSSTNSFLGTTKEKSDFVSKHSIESLNIYMDIYNDYIERKSVVNKK